MTKRLLCFAALTLSACLDLKPDNYRFALDAGEVVVGTSCSRSCETPPSARCLSARTLEAFPNHGLCTANLGCGYTPVTVTCSLGCEQNACVGEACAGVFCDQPPATVCQDTSHAIVFEPAGTCALGSCSYAASVVTCPKGCSNGVCAGNTCAGVSCDSPPAPVCLDAARLRYFASEGTCAAGRCGYPAHEVTCAKGCADGACVDDPCAGTTCNQPPAPFCVSDTVARTAAEAGTCSAGSCTYATSDVACTAGSSCQSGRCVKISATCTSASCADGCCAGDTCVRPATQTNLQCGLGAASCSACGTGSVCGAGLCRDLDECADQNGGCDPHATCTNTPGSRTCECDDGYIGNGLSCTADLEMPLGWSPSELQFGYVAPTASQQRSIVFTNASPSAAVSLTEISITPAGDFEAPTSLTVPAGGATTPLLVTCHPTASSPRVATLSFRTGLPKQPTGSVALKCTGSGPKVDVAPRAVRFEQVPLFVGASFTRRIVVKNVGGATPNLFLGKQGTGAPFAITPNVGTDASELAVALSTPYDTSVGLSSAAGQNTLELEVTLAPQSVGLKGATITLWSTDPAEPEVTVTVSAEVQLWPPCAATVSPLTLEFGLVPGGATKVLEVAVTNTGTAPGAKCFISSVSLAAGSAAAYAIVDAPLAPRVLGPGETTVYSVRVSPSLPTPTESVPLNGALEVRALPSGSTVLSVPLRASTGVACLTVSPDPYDFGSIKQGCRSASRTFNAYNTCAASVTLSRVAIHSGAEFSLTSAPAANTVVTPFSAPVQFQVSYAPTGLGRDDGTVAMNVLDGGTVLVGLAGLGAGTGERTDTFEQAERPKADILLVVDDSCSMEDKQVSLAANFNSFIRYATSAQVDYQLGVTSTSATDGEVCMPPFGCSGGTSKAKGGALFRDPANGVGPILTPMTPNAAQTFAKMVQLGTGGSAFEEGLEAATLALTPPLIGGANAGFLRSDANLAIVIVTDAGDQSPHAVSYYQDRLINIKGHHRLSMFAFNTIGPYLATAPVNCTYDGGGDVLRYDVLVNATAGVRDEICTTTWSTALERLGRLSFGARTRFFLSAAPDRGVGKVFEVKRDGVVVPSTGWAYDAATNSVVFPEAPPPRSTVTVRYEVTCL